MHGLEDAPSLLAQGGQRLLHVFNIGRDMPDRASSSSLATSCAAMAGRHTNSRKLREPVLNLFNANRALARLGLRVSRIRHDWGDVSTYIPFAETIADAARAKLSVGDYVDAIQGISGATQSTIDGMKRLGVFHKPIHALAEIGPGTGRYLEKTLRECSPGRCEIYETAGEWAAYLKKTFPVILQPTDGTSMQPTASASTDLVQAHKVFSTIPFIVTVRYWREMVRVARPGAHIVFDVMTENCLSPAVVEEWGRLGIPMHSSYPAALPYKVVVDFFAAHRVQLLGTFLSPMPPGETEVFVFRTT